MLLLLGGSMAAGQVVVHHDSHSCWVCAWCRFQTLYEIFSELNRAGSGVNTTSERGPVLLLLGGGMAAGKSTVREVIGHDDFWSKVTPLFSTPFLRHSAPVLPSLS